MYTSKLVFHTKPGQTSEAEKHLEALAKMVAQVANRPCRILRTHMASDGSGDLVFEQDSGDLAELESEIAQVVKKGEFQLWSKEMSNFLTHSPKREIYEISYQIGGQKSSLINSSAEKSR